MRVAILVFSPTGNTLKAGRMLERALRGRKAEVQLLDLTRDRQLFLGGDIRGYLEGAVEGHDVLCVGSPVYAHHLHHNVKDIIRALPPPGNGWGGISAPFVTYGGVNSGIALHEAARLFKRTGRVTAAGMKIDSEHVMLTRMKRLSAEINPGMPGDEALPVIEDLARRITALENTGPGECADITRSLRYQSLKGRVKAHIIFREKFWQSHLYPKVVFNLDKCTKCGRCARLCPVQRLEMTEGGPQARRGGPTCIHCASCIINCPAEAVELDADWAKWERMTSKAAKGLGPLPSNETPRSAVYPIL